MLAGLLHRTCLMNCPDGLYNAGLRCHTGLWCHAGLHAWAILGWTILGWTILCDWGFLHRSRAALRVRDALRV